MKSLGAEIMTAINGSFLHHWKFRLFSTYLATICWHHSASDKCTAFKSDREIWFPLALAAYIRQRYLNFWQHITAGRHIEAENMWNSRRVENQLFLIELTFDDRKENTCDSGEIPSSSIMRTKNKVTYLTFVATCDPCGCALWWSWISYRY